MSPKMLSPLSLLPALLLLAVNCQTAKPVRPLLPGMPYRMSEINYRVDDEKLGRVVKAARRKSVFKQGQPYSIYDFDKERTRLLALLKKHGRPELQWRQISFEVDTTLADQQFSVTAVISTAPQTAR
jgi:hypothetical protein